MKVSATIRGDREVAHRFERIGNEALPKLRRTVQRLGIKLQGHIQRDYLSGQVLKNRTGHLRSGINEKTTASLATVESTVGISPSTPYGVYWELGIKAHDVFAVNAKALRFKPAGAEDFIFRKKVHIPDQPARPFMKPALADMKDSIREQIVATVREINHE